MSAHPQVERVVADYLRTADRLLPGWITGFYVVGSAALGEFVPNRSDVDFVACVSGRVPARIARLRAVQIAAGLRTLRRGLGGMPNGVFVREQDMSRPVTTIEPVAAHVGGQLTVGKAFDVNPVTWKVLASHSLRFRGPEVAALGIDPEPDRLKQWNRENLDTYWRWWGEKGGRQTNSLSIRRYGRPWAVAWGTLGAPRLHCTIATGEVIGKRSAGEYALQVFDAEWHPIIRRGLDWWHRTAEGDVSRAELDRAADFVLMVVDSARSL